MRRTLDRHSSVDMGLCDKKWTNMLRVKFFGTFVIEDEAFVTWLIIMVAAFFVGTSKVIIDDCLTTCLQLLEIGE